MTDVVIRQAEARDVPALARLRREYAEEEDGTVADPDYGITFGLNFLPRSMAGLDDWLHRLPDPSLADVRTRANARTGRLLGGAPLRAAR